MTHICFDISGYCSIKHAMKLGLIEEDKIILFWDDLSVGNISDCRDYKLRKKTMGKIYRDEIGLDNDKEIEKKLDEFYKTLEEEENFIIWYVRNPKDCCNLYYVVSLVENKNIDVVRCIKKHNSKKTFYYERLGEVLPEDMPILLRKKINLSGEYKKKCIKTWEKLVSENGSLRIKDNKRIKTVEENYYDKLILNRITYDYRRIVRVVGDIIGRDTPYLESWFILSRIEFLINAGCLEINYRCDKYMFNNIRKHQI